MKPNLLRITVAAALLAAGAAQAQVVIYKQPNFTGAALTLTKDDENLTNEGFLDQASSLVISSGRWEFCSQPKFAGDCRVLEAGQYATLPQVLNHRIESVRQVGGAKLAANDPRDPDRRSMDGRRDGERRDGSYRDGDRYADGRRDGRRDGRWRRDPGSIEVFGGQSFRGRGMLLERDTADLGEFDARVSSVIVHEGVWEVCTGMDYAGTCVVLEPGRYSTLGRMDNRVASVRRVG